MSAQSLHMNIYWRRRLAECIAETFAYRTAKTPDEFLGGIRIRGSYPNFTVHISDHLVDKIKQFGICMDPCFELTYLDAVKENYVYK